MIPSRNRLCREAWVYVDRTDTAHFLKWYEGLKDQRVRARVQARIRLMEQAGFGDTKPLGPGLWEARIHLGSGWRLYFGLEGRKIILLILGGSKRAQKRDIEKAKNLWSEYAEEKTKKRWI